MHTHTLIDAPFSMFVRLCFSRFSRHLITHSQCTVSYSAHLSHQNSGTVYAPVSFNMSHRCTHRAHWVEMKCIGHHHQEIPAVSSSIYPSSSLLSAQPLHVCVLLLVCVCGDLSVCVDVGGPADPIAPTIIIPPRNTSVVTGTSEVTMECVANAR